MNPQSKAGTAVISAPAPQLGLHLTLLPQRRSGTAGCAPVWVNLGKETKSINLSVSKAGYMLFRAGTVLPHLFATV